MIERTVDLRGDPERELADVAEHIRSGGTIAYPTETVYGIGALPDPAGVAAVQRVKGRAADKPLIVLVPSARDAEGLRWTNEARTLAEIFWPGSVTLVLEDPDEIFPDGIRSPVGAVGVRLSPHPIVSRLLAALGAPLTSTSLNAPGRAPARSGTEAVAALTEMASEGTWLLDVGTLPPSAPSTVVDCTGQAPVVLREGSVPVGRLRCALPEIRGS
ncbi:MAG: L-threonylcarbamoyladenylate synthase [Gemmatimonadota bacterium]